MTIAYKSIKNIIHLRSDSRIMVSFYDAAFPCKVLWRAAYDPADRQPVGVYFTPTVNPVGGVLHHPCTVPVYKLLFI